MCHSVPENWGRKKESKTGMTPRINQAVKYEVPLMRLPLGMAIIAGP